MKTVEEKAREASCDYGIDDIQHRTMFASGYLQGYNEAMRWRDPKEEQPENVGLYLCKCEKKLGFYFDIVFFNKVWRSDNVIGWRPIE